MADLGRAAVRGAGATLLSQGARFALQMAALIVLARLLSPSAFGLVAMVTSAMGVAELIRDFGLSSAAIQAKHLDDAERTNLFWVNVAIGGACALVAAAAAPLIAELYSEPHVRPIVWSLAWLLLVSGMTTQFRAELSRSLRFTSLAVTDVVAQALGIATAITAALLGAGYWSLVGQQIVFVVTTCVLAVGLCRWRPGLPDRSVSIRRFFRFGGGVLGTQVLGYTTNNADNVGLGAVWGAGPLGIYSRAYQLLIVPLNQINTPMTRVVLPVLSRMQDDPAGYQRYIEKAQLIGSYLLATGFGVAAALSQPLVALLFGPRWSAVAPVFAVLALGGIFRGVGLVTYWIFLSRGLSSVQLKLYLVTRPVMIAVILAGLPWGPLGVAAGHSLAFALYWVVSLWYAGRRADVDAARLFRQAVRSLGLVTVPSALLALLGSSLAHRPLVQVLLGGGFAAGYLALVFTVSPRERSELAETRRLLRRPPSAEAPRVPVAD